MAVNVNPPTQVEVVVPDNEKAFENQNRTEKPDANDAVPQTRPSIWRKLNPLRLQKIPPVPQERQVTKEYGANIFSHIFFEWMTPFMKVGYLRPLEPQDIWTVNPKRAVEILSDNLDVAFKKRIERGSKRPLAWALFDSLRTDLIIGGVCQLVGMLCLVLSPYLVRHLIAFSTEAYAAHITGKPGPSIGPGLGYAFGLYAMQVLQSLTMNQALYRGMLVGGMAKAALTSKIFLKAMKLSNRAKAGGKALKSAEDKEDASQATKKTSKKGAGTAQGETPGWSNGRITTLMGVDVDRIDRACGMLHLLWCSPIGLIVALVILIINIGYSALAGYALLVLGMLVLTWAMGLLVRFRKAINKITDQRVTLTQEILYSVRFVKFFGWESSFLQRLEAVRRHEVDSIKKLLFVRHAVVVCLVSLPTFASLLSFVTYALSKHGMSPDRIFASLALFNVLRMPLTMLNMTITQATDAWTAITRIQEFLLAEEKSDPVEWDMGLDKAIEVERASFTWEHVQTAKGDEKKEVKPKGFQSSKVAPSSTPDTTSDMTEQEPFKLRDIDFDVGRNELLAVIGTVGSGKSSLLGALAGDMRLTAGKVRMGATRSFCPQYAWIQNVSVRENILFGSEYDENFYDSVIDACALRSDLEIFPNGDETEIGERGITVSGGQKQRINIARAVYSRAEIVLMDDPLSAVDAHVGRHIMDRAICGLLKDRCRVLATHQLHVLSRCDRIIVMKEGAIDAIDTFDNLMRDNEQFRDLMSSTSQQEKSEDLVDGQDDGEAQPTEPAQGQAKKAKPAAALMSKEERATGSVGWKVWKAYISATGSFLINCGAFLVLLACLNCGLIMTGLWVSYWTSNKFPALSTGQYMGIYAGICSGQTLALYLFALHVTIAATYASKAMLQRAMYRVLRAPMSFFDTTPLGRITNRFSKDVQVMDSDLGDSIRMFAFTFTQILCTMGLIIAFYHYFAIALGPLFILFLLAATYYRASARNLKRHDSVLRSTVFARFGEAINGVASIQAYKMEGYFQRNLHESINSMNGAYFLTFSNQRWLSIRLDAIGSLLILVVGILVVTSRFNVGPSVSGLVLSYVLNITLSLQFTIRQFAEVGNNMNSAERIHYYGTDLDEEPPLHLADVPPSWPEKGRITFSDVQMRYRDGLPLVLKGLTMDVHGGERIGIVGRTGAGKSSIMSALFRLTELSGGSIKIDDVDIATVGLLDLRTRLAIIPQDPTLFRGTIRSNLDPFNEHTDLELWAALRKAHLVGQEVPAQEDDDSPDGTLTPPSVNEKLHAPQRLHLDTTVEEEGLNFSLGQRQLMALARALVRDARIIVCDEATSSVDFETDQKVQETMTQGFRGKTLLCIAHRLRTIIHYDRICVMDQGRIAELGTPLALWGKPGGIFRSMCDQSGITREDFQAVYT